MIQNSSSLPALGDGYKTLSEPVQNTILPVLVVGGLVWLWLKSTGRLKAITNALSAQMPTPNTSSSLTGGTASPTVFGNDLSGTVGGTDFNAPSSSAGQSGLSIVQQATAAAGVPATWATDPALWKVLMLESSSTPSSLNSTEQNPTSSAYGAFQFLNSTWAGETYPKTSNPLQQAVDGLEYIKNRYGSPEAALQHENAYHWY